MKKLCIFGVCLVAFATACRDEVADFPDAAPDSGTSLPDARVIDRFDSGARPPEYPEPMLQNVSPGFGPETGGTRVVLRGAGFAEPIAGSGDAPVQVFFGTNTATRVVVLDEVSIAATTPPGAIGTVDVKVVTPGGESVLIGGFRYHRDLRITAIEPARIPEEGGVPIAIRGRGFDENTVVLIGRKPLAGARLVSSERIEGYAPALPAGRPDVHAFTFDAEDRRSDLLLVYRTPEIERIAPGYGPIGGGLEQAIAGSSLDDVSRATLNILPVSFDVRAGDRVDFTPIAVGFERAYDVTVGNRDASDTLPGGYIAYDPRGAGFSIIGVTPHAASTAGGEVIAVVGHGFTAASRVQIGGVDATVRNADLPHALWVVVPANLVPGPNDVTVIDGASTATARGALRIFTAIEVLSITPDTGPVGGGTNVRITGKGFAPGVEVRIGDVPLANVVVVADNEITATTVAGAHGPQDVVVKNRDSRGVLEDAFFFDEPFQVIRIDPIEGSVAGNTLVSVLGRGFTGTVGVSFDSVPGLVPQLENGSVISARTQPANTGRADVRVDTSRGGVTLEDAYEFYDPRIITGGVWGGPIEGSVNVGVLDSNSGQPLPGIVVQLGYDADPRYTAITDENGLATISWPEVRGPHTVTVGQNQVEHVTFVEVNARNITAYAAPYPMSQPPDAPLSPCPAGAQAPLVRGRVFRFKSSLDPVTRPGWRPVAQITYSQPSVFGTNPPDPPEQFDQVFSDGEEFEIVVMRAGTVAVYAILGDYNDETREFIPRKFGVVRSVPAAPGEVTTGVNISLDVELDRMVDLRLDDPPAQTPGPSVNAVFPYLNLGSDGVIAFNPTIVPDGSTVRLTGLPNIAGADFFYLGGSFTLTQQGTLSAPYSLTLTQSDDDAADGLDIGPFLKMPEDVTPKTGQVLEGGRLSWKVPGIQPDLTSILVLDVTAVSGCCCLDLNQNGLCEAEEPPQCGGLPVQYVRWSVFGPGGLQSYAMPPMPAGVQAFEMPQVYQWNQQSAIAPRFNYDEWIFNQYSPYFWKSWTLSADLFLAKEETD